MMKITIHVYGAKMERIRTSVSNYVVFTVRVKIYRQFGFRMYATEDIVICFTDFLAKKNGGVFYYKSTDVSFPHIPSKCETELPVNFDTNGKNASNGRETDVPIEECDLVRQ